MFNMVINVMSPKYLYNWICRLNLIEMIDLINVGDFKCARKRGRAADHCNETAYVQLHESENVLKMNDKLHAHDT